MSLFKYPNLKASRTRWAWEFLRRNSDYIASYIEWAKFYGIDSLPKPITDPIWQSYLSRKYPYYGSPSDNEQKKTRSWQAVLIHDCANKVCSRFGLSLSGHLPHPLENTPWKSAFEDQFFAIKSPTRTTHVSLSGKLLNSDRPMNPCEVGVIFDVTKSIDQQIEEAKRTLLWTRRNWEELGILSKTDLPLTVRQEKLANKMNTINARFGHAPRPPSDFPLASNHVGILRPNYPLEPKLWLAYLKAYDFCATGKRGGKKVGCEFYPNDSPDKAQKKLSDHFTKALKFIDGDYKKIVGLK